MNEKEERLELLEWKHQYRYAKGNASMDADSEPVVKRKAKRSVA